MTSNCSNVLLQCTRVGKQHSYPIDLIIDSHYCKTLEAYEHTASSPFDFNKIPLDIESLEGELLEIDSIKCDHQIDSKSVLSSLTKHLKSLQINVNAHSLESLRNISWPGNDFKL